ncbi:hypothetical protein PENSPDRAFT_686907 [Peniophora sp. CONT]|nr:hypothetical protein PENSPDRAFT_686907 [Peniophora sp. CONT]
MWTKLALLFVTAASVHVSLSPPQPAAPPKTLAGPRTFFEYIVRYITLCTKSLTWLFVTIDALATLALYAQPEVAPPMCPRSPASPTTLTYVSPLLIAGTLSAFAGGALRAWCYRTLGRLFTFEISIMEKHALVTSGPYAIVRHPSYSGIYLTLGGATAALAAPSSWAQACGVLRAPTTLTDIFAWTFAAAWCVKCGYAMYSTLRRGPIEDEQLHKQFGSEYAKATPYRMIPFVL